MTIVPTYLNMRRLPPFIPLSWFERFSVAQALSEEKAGNPSKQLGPGVQSSPLPRPDLPWRSAATPTPVHVSLPVS